MEIPKTPPLLPLEKVIIPHPDLCINNTFHILRGVRKFSILSIKGLDASDSSIKMLFFFFLPCSKMRNNRNRLFLRYFPKLFPSRIGEIFTVAQIKKVTKKQNRLPCADDNVLKQGEQIIHRKYLTDAFVIFFDFLKTTKEETKFKTATLECLISIINSYLHRNNNTYLNQP